MSTFTAIYAVNGDTVSPFCITYVLKGYTVSSFAPICGAKGDTIRSARASTLAGTTRIASS